MSVLTPTAQRFSYCNFVGTFEILKCKSSKFIFFKNVLTILGTLNFHTNLRMGLSFCKVASMTVTGIVLNLQIILESIPHLTVSSLPSDLQIRGIFPFI